MNYLDEIVKHKIKETEERKLLYPTQLLERSIYFETKPVSLKEYILREDKSGIIAEFKRKSPSKGMINEYASVEQISIGYMQAEASALSVLTDNKYFGGSSKDLIVARQLNYCPILRKDFILEEYQVIESKSIGADAILLIAAILEKDKIKKLVDVGKKLELEIILEIHSKEELDKLDERIDIVGVNNRDLNSFEVSLNTSKMLSKLIPLKYLKIAESGIKDVDDIIELKSYDYKGFLIGESFMRSANPEKSCMQMIKELKSKTMNLKYEI